MEFSHPPPNEMRHPAGPPPSTKPSAGDGGAGGGGGGDDFSMPPPSAKEADNTNSGSGDGGGGGGGGGGEGGGGGGGGFGGGRGFRGGYRGHYRGGFHHNNHHGGGFHGGHRHYDGGGGGRGGGAGNPGQPFFRSFGNFGRGPSGMPMTQDDFDGKRLRKSVMRKTVDYNAAIIRALENRVWQRDFRDRRALQPESIYAPEMLPPPSYMDNPTNAVTTRFVKTATNKMRCPIFTLAWTPEGRRLVTGASSGEFTLWNGLTFNFETILQAHDCPVRTMVWSHNDNWMVTGDHQGNVKYWQSNMNNVRAFQAHKDPVRGISFSPSDNKFVSCSDDGTLRVFDFLRCQEENVLRGHGADVKCVHWHPQKSLIVSGSKDNQQPIKLWDPKSGQSLATLHAHKSTVMDLKWNNNGNWLITASRDHLLKLFDLRNLKQEVQVFRGHKKEASAVSWHPVHEGLFSSGGSDGSILFWNVGTDKEVGAIEGAHDSIVWTLAWHPLGHILCSGSNDHTIKFWTRNRPGDAMRDKYNLNTLPVGLQGMEDGMEIDDNHIIPGMGPEDKIDFPEASQPSSLSDDRGGNIPGLDLDTSSYNKDRGGGDRDKKVPYSKPIPRNFQAQWNDNGRPDEEEFGGDVEGQDGGKMGGMQFDGLPDMSVQPPNMSAPPPIQQPSAIIVYGVTIIVKPGSRLAEVISEGPGALNRFISAREIPELNDQLPPAPQFDESNGAKRPCIDHNAQLIFDQNSGSIGFIPPPMALSSVAGNDGQPLNVSQPPPDFMMPMNGGPGGPGAAAPTGDMDMWSGPPPGGQWRVPPNGGGGGHMGGDPSGQWMPPNHGHNGGDDEFSNRGRRDGRVSRFENGQSNNGGMGGNQRGFGGNYNRGGFGGGGNNRFGNGGGGGDENMGYNMNHMGGGGPGPQDNMQFNNFNNGNGMMNNNRGHPNNRPPNRRY